mmetsp:Transcript_573/g.1784  ORF Transcript_573/g.1784 Transcript_573/m.1784 type:complete len:323 (+) Transcript_573:485-1453(+)
MDSIRIYGVAVQVAATLNRIFLAVNLHRVRLHDFFNLSTNVTQSHVNTRRSNSTLRGFVHGFQQRIIHVIKRLRERAVDDAALHLNPKVKLYHIILINHALVPAVWRPVRGHVILRAPGWKRHARLESALFNQFPYAILQRLAHVDVLHPRFHPLLYVRPNLAMHLGALSSLVIITILNAFQLALLFVTFAPKVVRVVFEYLPDWVLAAREQRRHRYRRRFRLLPARTNLHRTTSLFLLFLFLLLLFLPISGVVRRSRRVIVAVVIAVSTHARRVRRVPGTALGRCAAFARGGGDSHLLHVIRDVARDVDVVVVDAASSSWC